ncbi:MAG: hypothetical protein U1F35_09845 [Steroidobacteraceae bacterium]
MKAPINSRFGRRVVALFVLSAVVPLVLASVLLTRQFNAQHELDQAREMDLAIRAYGTSVMSRLNEADDLLDTLKATASLDDDHLASVVASVPWAKSVHRTSVEPTAPSTPRSRNPMPIRRPCSSVTTRPSSWIRAPPLRASTSCGHCTNSACTSNSIPAGCGWTSRTTRPCGR